MFVSVCLYPYVCIRVDVSVCMYLYALHCMHWLSVHPSFHLSVCLSVCPSVRLSVCLSLRLPHVCFVYISHLYCTYIQFYSTYCFCTVHPVRQTSEIWSKESWARYRLAKMTNNPHLHNYKNLRYIILIDMYIYICVCVCNYVICI